MKKSCIAALTVLLPSVSPQMAFSAASQWEEVQGGAVRVVLSSEPGANGGIRGALQIELEPGWKTYWLDPGDAGVPPSVTASRQREPAEVEIGFPPPGRHDDGYSVWAGYDQPVSFALAITPHTQANGPIEFSVFIGVCETICIPVQANFSVDPDGNMADAEHEAIVDDAFAALPGEPHDGLRVTSARIDGESVMIEAEVPSGATADLFLASTENRMLGTPEQTSQDGKIAFRVPVLSGGTDAEEDARYTLISGDEAVSGTITVRP